MHSPENISGPTSGLTAQWLSDVLEAFADAVVAAAQPAPLTTHPTLELVHDADA